MSIMQWWRGYPCRVGGPRYHRHYNINYNIIAIPPRPKNVIFFATFVQHIFAESSHRSSALISPSKLSVFFFIFVISRKKMYSIKWHIITRVLRVHNLIEIEKKGYKLVCSLKCRRSKILPSPAGSPPRPLVARSHYTVTTFAVYI